MRRFTVLLASLALSRAVAAQSPEPSPEPEPNEVIVVERPATPEPPPTAPSSESAAPASASEPAHTPPLPPESEPVLPDEERFAHHRDFGFELDLGFNTRLGKNGSYTNEQAYGASYGLGAWLSLVDRVELGLELTRTDLGRVSNEYSPELLWAEYAVTTLWAGGRFEPWRSADVAPFVALRVGLGMQDVDARGIRESGTDFAPAGTFSCSELDGPGFSLGGGVGAALLLGRHVQLVGRIDASAQRLEGDRLGSCATGIGSVTSVGFGLGIAYGFETRPAS